VSKRTEIIGTFAYGYAEAAQTPGLNQCDGAYEGDFRLKGERQNDQLVQS
jgi:hypothetical protein